MKTPRFVRKHGGAIVTVSSIALLTIWALQSPFFSGEYTLESGPYQTQAAASEAECPESSDSIKRTTEKRGFFKRGYFKVCTLKFTGYEAFQD